MKRFLAAVFVFAFIFSACSSNTGTKAPVTDFCADVKLNVGEKEFSGMLDCNSANDITLTFTKPDGINGFSVLFKDDTYVCDIAGISDTVQKDLCTDSVISAFFEALSIFLFSPADLTKKQDGDYSATALNGKYCAVFSDDGKLKLVYSTPLNFSAEFINIIQDTK